MQNHSRPLVNSISRRSLLQATAAAGLTTWGVSASTQAAEQQPTTHDRLFGRAKSVILLWLSGGPPQHETFDPKPDAPAEIRGPFQPISTNVPGIHFSELLPRTAGMADKLAVVRSLFTNNNIHGGSGYWVLTGRQLVSGDGENPRPDDWPFMASMVKLLRPSEKLPALTSVTLPEVFIGNGGNLEAGQFGGFMGSQWNPRSLPAIRLTRAFNSPAITRAGYRLRHLHERTKLLQSINQQNPGYGASPSLGPTLICNSRPRICSVPAALAEPSR